MCVRVREKPTCSRAAAVSQLASGGGGGVWLVEINTAAGICLGCVFAACTYAVSDIPQLRFAWARGCVYNAIG